MPSSAERVAALFEALRTDAVETDREGGFPSASIDHLRRAGLLAAPVPASAGGEGLGSAACTGELLATLAQVGRASLVVGRLYEGHVNAVQLVARFGTVEQRARWFGDARDGKLFGVWNTEAADGVKLSPSGAAGAGTRRMAGAKTFASGCGHVERALVTAALANADARVGEAGGNGAWQMTIVATDRSAPREDRSFWKPLGMRATASFRADFTDLRIGDDDLLGAPGDYYREPAFSGGAIRFAAVQQGGIEAIFDETRAFLGRLGRTSDPFQRIRLGEMAMRVESGRLWLDGAARQASAAMAETDDGRGAADTVAYAQLVRSAIEDNALRVMQLAERSVGARGLLRPEPFERLHRDLTHYLRQPAPDGALAGAGAHVLDRQAPAAELWR